MASTSIPAWLDAVKAGYGDKYSACFDDLGIDDVADISENLGKAAVLAALEEGLCKAGAKMVHIANIKSAIAKVAMPHRPEAPVSSKQASPNKQHSGRTLQGGGDCAMIEWTKRDSGKRFACFLSHHKASCAMEARFLKDKLSNLIQKECFLDSDNLRNLRELLDSVRNSDVLVIVQSAEVLTRPWCLLEMVAAVDAGVPMIAIAVSGKGYNFATATNLLKHLDTKLDEIYPGACDMLREHGVQPIDAAFKLSMAVPNMISLPFNASASGGIIQASLVDIVAAMNTVKPMPQPRDREDWIQGRSVDAAKLTTAIVREHGDSANGAAATAATAAPAAAPAPAAESAPAPIPSTVPEQPDVMAERPAMLAEMRYFLLGAEGSAGTIALSSEKKSKVAAHGMGGVGKTTMAAAVVRDSAVRDAFDRIAWVSVGQTPAVMELQCVLYQQLTTKPMPVQDGANAATQLEDLQAACIGKRWLIVLDDVWEKEHETHLSCVDAASPSKLLVTTRIRGLLKGCAEVSLNLLAPAEAADLLLRTGAVGDVDAAASAAAAEIAELCGNLPLYISICGGLLLGYEGDAAWKAELPAMLTDDRVGVIEEGAGDRTVQCLVDSSLSMLKDKAAASAFMALGVCPEDVLIKLTVVQLVVEAGAGDGVDGGDIAASGAAKTAATRRIIKALVDRNLLQGDINNGVQMHDIVRDLVRSRLGGEDGIRTKQRAVVAAFMSVCSAEGWAGEEAVGLYAAQALEQHMVEALLPDPLDDAEAHAWLLHASDAIVASAATALGSATLEALSSAKEGAGDLVGAARVAWAARLVRGCAVATVVDLIFRAAVLLGEADDASCLEFELVVRTLGSTQNFGSERHTSNGVRLTALWRASSTTTFSTQSGQLFGAWMPPFVTWLSTWGEHPFGAPHWSSLTPDNVRTATSKMRQTSMTLGVQASSLSDIPGERDFAALWWGMNLFATSRTCDMDDWNTQLCGGESALMEAGEHWTKSNRQSGKDLLKGGCPINLYLYGYAPSILALHFGRVPALVQWSADAAAEFKELDLVNTQDYSSVPHETMNSRFAAMTLVGIGRPAEAYAVLEAMGFIWTDEGLVLYELWFAAISQTLPGWAKDADAVWHRLLLYLAAPQSAALDAEVSSWIPSPAAIAEHERSCPWSMHWGVTGMLCLATSVFLRLGRSEEAAEAACILVSPEHHCMLPSDLAHGHGVLGQVAAEHGGVEAADGHFERALAAAAGGPYPLVEVLVARDWKQVVPASAGAADAVIDAACVKMDKSRSEVECGLG
jgi:hypothetical protein